MDEQLIAVGSAVSGQLSAQELNVSTASEPVAEPVKMSRQVRRANARRGEKSIKRHMNEVVLKKNRKR